MLKVFFKEDNDLPSDLELITDIEPYWVFLDLGRFQSDAQILSFIENASIASKSFFFDRFGFRLPANFLSTGLKIALMCSRLNPNQVLDTVECGFNAKVAIFNYCKNGSILITEPIDSIPVSKNYIPSPIWHQGKIYEDLNQFNMEVI